MVSVKQSQAEQASKKKRVTFSLCTDKSDSYSKVPIQSPNEVSARLSKYLDKDSERDKYWNPLDSTLKRLEIPKTVKVSGKACNVKKTLVRNVEQVLPPHCALIRGRPCPSISADIVHGKPGSDAKKSSYKSKFAVPELYTTLYIAKEIQDTAKLDAKQPSGIGIHPPAKQVLDVKILSKLNIPFEEKLYKDLISLTVCDEELLGSDDRVGSKREVEFRQCKDQEPQLTDFCTPSDGKEYSVVEQPAPCGMERIRSYNGFTLYERCQRWFCDDQG